MMRGSRQSGALSSIGETTLTLYSPEVTEHSGAGAQAAYPARRSRLTSFEFSLIAFVIASFAYEIPLVYVSSMYKLNPYLFNIAALMLISYWLLVGRAKGWQLSLALRNPLAMPWLVIVGTFLWATIVSATWVPFQYYRYSLFYFLEYVVGLAVLLIVLAAPLDERAKRRLLWVALFAGTWVAFYAVLQVVGVAGTARVIPKGWEVAEEGTGIISTLGVSYFHAGWFSVISTLVGLTLVQSSRGPLRVVAAVLTLVCTIPAAVSGARAAFMALGIALFLVAIRREYRRHLATWVMAALALGVITFFYSESLTRERYERHDDTQSRILQGPRGIVKVMKEHFPIMPIAGGGFYVVPHGNHWRVGYGIHNLYLRPLEQGGVPSFIASIWLWIRLGTHLGRRQRTPSANALDEHFRAAMFAYFVSLLMAGWAGGHFWLQFNTEHLNSFLILMLGLALSETGGSPAEPDPSPPVYERPQPEPLSP
jgi:hypothetical protein